jgi:hypothetical protein
MKNQDLSHEIWLHYGDDMQAEVIETKEPITAQRCEDIIWEDFEPSIKVISGALHSIFAAVIVKDVDWDYIARMVNLCLED